MMWISLFTLRADKADILILFRNVPNLDLNKIKDYADIFQVWNEVEEIRKRV